MSEIFFFLADCAVYFLQLMLDPSGRIRVKASFKEGAPSGEPSLAACFTPHISAMPVDFLNYRRSSLLSSFSSFYFCILTGYRSAANCKSVSGARRRAEKTRSVASRYSPSKRT